MRKFIFIILAIITASIFFAVLHEKREQRLLKSFLNESPRYIKLRSITFDSQQRILVIKDEESLACIAASISTAERNFRAGVAYSAIFQLEDGTEIDTFVYLDGRYLTVAGAYDGETSDPEYYLSTLPINLPGKLSDALVFLETKEIPKQKNLTIQ
ncbi:MAG TPA: hypothetical protein VL357_07570 [Rariglobus sp.]|nr:hypothetical protein [Rariglobus sp.]